MAARRWLLFGLSLASLLAMTYAGVSLAFSVKVTPEMEAADAEARVGSRMLVRMVSDPSEVHTFQDGTVADLLVSGRTAGFVAAATEIEIGRAVAYVSPDGNGTYSPATVRARDGNETNVSALAQGGTGWLVQGEDDPAPRFVPSERMLGKAERFENATILPALFMAGLVGFVAPLVVIVATHKGAGRRGSPTGAFCRECRAPMPPSATFCMRCGAYVKET